MARILGRIFAALGLLVRPEVVEAHRGDLVGEHLGSTAIKTNRLVDSALGGVLFVDEAYSLHNEGYSGGDAFGAEAVQTLLKRAEDDRDRLVIVLAGYPADMDRFLRSNPGLASRFSTRVTFPSYTARDLSRIAVMQAEQAGDAFEPEAVRALSRSSPRPSGRADRRARQRPLRPLPVRARLRLPRRPRRPPGESGTAADLTTLTAADVAAPTPNWRSSSRSDGGEAASAGACGPPTLRLSSRAAANKLARGTGGISGLTGRTFTDIVARRPDGFLGAQAAVGQPGLPGRRGGRDQAPAGRRAGRAAAGRPIAAVRLGTTVATNALLERKGEPTALVITEGFGDALRIAYQNRPRIFDRHIVLPEQLYDRVIEVPERVGAHGEVVRPLDAAASNSSCGRPSRPGSAPPLWSACTATGTRRTSSGSARSRAGSGSPRSASRMRSAR